MPWGQMASLICQQVIVWLSIDEDISPLYVVPKNSVAQEYHMTIPLSEASKHQKVSYVAPFLQTG